jgi:hypothetical protein
VIFACSAGNSDQADKQRRDVSRLQRLMRVNTAAAPGE